MPLKTVPFDASEHFDDEASQAALIADAFESGHPGYIANAFGVVARARGMSDVARQAGVTREALYKALREDGDPRMSTLLGVAKAIGVRLTVMPLGEAPAAKRASKRAPKRPAAKKPRKVAPRLHG